MADDTESEETETDEEKFERMYEARRKRERDEAKRRDDLKKMGVTDDVLNAIADAVWNRGEERAAERKRREEEADQEPSRTTEQTKLGKLFGIGNG